MARVSLHSKIGNRRWSSLWAANRLMMVLVVLLAMPVCGSWAQDEEAEQAGSGVRVRGQLVVTGTEIQVELAEIEMTLEEIVEAPIPPLPANFDSLSIEQRQKWFQEFQASDAGKRFQAELAKIDAARKKFTVKSDAEGKFVFEGAFPGNFGLFGQKEFIVDGKTYLADFFAEVPIGEGVKFLDLGAMPLEIRRILKVGDAAPDMVLKPKTEDQAAEVISLKELAGKPILLCFFTLESLPRIQAAVDAVAAEKPEQVQVMGVHLDPVSAETTKQLAEMKIKWKVLPTSGLESAPVVIDYGILALPGFCLIDQQGKVLLNDETFYEALNAEGETMVTVIRNAVQPKK
jgi:peroxiredoxin